MPPLENLRIQNILGKQNQSLEAVSADQARTEGRAAPQNIGDQEPDFIHAVHRGATG